MSEQLTEQQKQAVYDRGGRLLVSAAAGSGKTKVLVDRLMSYLTDPVAPANIDDFLIITYTKAAASELRGKIAAKLSEAIAKTGDNKHLLKQLQRLHLTKISTVHAFCSDILREYAYMLDISSDFRVADEDECLVLRNRALQTVLEAAYSETVDEAFYTFVDTQGFGRDDRKISEIILQVYDAAKCHLNPKGWLDWCVGVQELDKITDMSQTVWGKFLIDDLHAYLDLQISTFMRCITQAGEDVEMGKPVGLLSATVEQLQLLRNCEKWDDICNCRNIDYGRLTFSKKCTDALLIGQIKAVRDACKAGLTKKLSAFCGKSERILEDYRGTLISASGLISLVHKFEATYDRLKRSRRVLDFSDLEHKTLDLLLGKSRAGSTKVASEIAERFCEVMVDEYQDSNAVQDAIFSVLTEKRKNCFMVGDVKQSIYQFRLADPTIFIDKYNRYLSAEEAKPGQGRKVILSRNFRSSGAVIRAVNDVFETCMSPAVGGLNYGDDEALYEGIPHIPLNEPDVELYGIDVQQDTYMEEAEFVAQKIAKLLDGEHMVRQNDTLRPIQASDIVILLRSPGSVGFEYQYALEQKGIRCVSGTGVDLLQTEEIENLHALLQVINNPLVDIPLVAVLMSRLFGFSADELATIRSERKYGSIYSALAASDSPKAAEFMRTLSDLRATAQLSSVSQLLLYIFNITRIDSIYSAMPDGAERVANLQQFCQIAASFESTSAGDLSRFLDHIESLSERGLMSATVEKTDNAVTIMSIHKSKGLEFPVVFLCGLARDFNQESTRAQVLCDKELGLGLNCVDVRRRFQYPSIAKRAIAVKMRAESISEELRVLYVAMTRARDRLIMTYSVKGVEEDLETISLRMAFSEPLLLNSTVHCPGEWILITANACRGRGWKLQLIDAVDMDTAATEKQVQMETLRPEVAADLRNSLEFSYRFAEAVNTPSKQTATQMKGREKDRQAAEHTEKAYIHHRIRKIPAFIDAASNAADHGTAMHAVMQYIRFDMCGSIEGVDQEVGRLLREKYITRQQADSVSTEEIAAFFQTEIGMQVRKQKNVLREFKFSVLTDATDGKLKDPSDRVLLQGVVDCALIEPDGITVIDFKSDRIGADGLDSATKRYAEQVKIYAHALSRIYQLPVKAAMLYFFKLGEFSKVI